MLSSLAQPPGTRHSSIHQRMSQLHLALLGGGALQAAVCSYVLAAQHVAVVEAADAAASRRRARAPAPPTTRPLFNVGEAASKQCAAWLARSRQAVVDGLWGLQQAVCGLALSQANMAASMPSRADAAAPTTWAAAVADAAHSLPPLLASWQARHGPALRGDSAAAWQAAAATLTRQGVRPQDVRVQVLREGAALLHLSVCAPLLALWQLQPAPGAEAESGVGPVLASLLCHPAAAPALRAALATSSWGQQQQQQQQEGEEQAGAVVQARLQSFLALAQQGEQQQQEGEGGGAAAGQGVVVGLLGMSEITQFAEQAARGAREVLALLT